MKRIALFFMMFFLGSSIYAQENNGTVYSEHESIEKTKALWSAFVKGDKEVYMGFFADTAYVFANGTLNKNKEVMKGWMDWWSNVDNFKVEDYKPAYPDAIEYKTGGTWVQDWLRFSGIHKKSGVRMDMHFHNLYSAD